MRPLEMLRVLDRSGNVISDPSGAMDRFAGLRWRTGLPGGFLDCEFMAPMDMLRDWLVREAYTLEVWDGQRICYEGSLENLDRAMALPNPSGFGQRRVTAFGFHINAVQRVYTAVHAANDGDTIIQAALGNCPAISTDYGQVSGLNRNLGAIEWDHTPVSDVARDCCEIGDNAAPPGTWWFAVWDSLLSSDGLPQAYLYQYDVTDYELQIPLAVISGQVGVNRSLDRTANQVVAKYEQNYTGIASDATSQASYGIRDAVYQAGSVALATAQAARDRYLELYKEPKDELSNVTLLDDPLTKDGVKYHMNRVRAGMRYVVPELRRQMDEIYYIIGTDYNADAHTLTIAIGEPLEQLVPREVAMPPGDGGGRPTPPYHPPAPAPWPGWPEPRPRPEPVPRRYWG